MAVIFRSFQHSTNHKGFTTVDIVGVTNTYTPYFRILSGNHICSFRSSGLRRPRKENCPRGQSRNLAGIHRPQCPGSMLIRLLYFFWWKITTLLAVRRIDFFELGLQHTEGEHTVFPWVLWHPVRCLSVHTKKLIAVFMKHFLCHAIKRKPYQFI